MALQVALSQLRHSRDTSTKKNDKEQHPARSESRKPGSQFESATSTISLFSVDEAELFNFSDEEFLPNDVPLPLPLPPSVCTSTSVSTSSTVSINSVRGSTFIAEQGHGDNSSQITGVSPHETCTSSKSNRSAQSHSEYSPCTKTLEKLRSFKFIKTSSLKSRSAHPKRPPTSDSQSELTPPPTKRRSVCNDVTNWDSPADTDAGHDNVSTSNSEPIFKQPSFNPRTSLNIFTHAPLSSQTEDQSSSMGAKVTPTINLRQTECSNFTISRNCHLSNNSLPSTPTLSNSMPHTTGSVSGGMSAPQSTVYNSKSRLSTPQRSVVANPVMPTPTRAVSNSMPHASIRGGVSTPQSARLTTPQRSIADSVMQTPTRVRQATPLVCTPTGSGVATPITRASIPLKRKFPGPAGLLPSLASGQSMDNIYIPPPSTPTPASTPTCRGKGLGFPATPVLSNSIPAQPHCTPEDIAMFTSSPWTDMMEDLDLNSTSAQSTALSQYNIASSLKQASSKQLKNGKVVHLRAVIKNILPAGKNASALLKDPTGEVMCTIHSKVVEDHQKELHPGAVLVLRQVSVFSPSPRKHYFNITPSNIVRVYPAHSSNSAEKTPQPPLSLSDVIGGEDSEDNASGHSQYSLSMKEFNPSGVTNINSSCAPSQPRQVQEIGSQSSRQRTNSLFSRTTNSSSTQLSNLQSLTIGAASFLATHRLSSHSNSNANGSYSEGSIVTSNANSKTGRVSNCDSSSEALLDDLPCDFNDFSDDDDDDITCTDLSGGQTSVFDRVNPASDTIAFEGIDTSGHDTTSAVTEGTAAPKESSFFNKLCEDEFDDLFNDIADDGLDF